MKKRNYEKENIRQKELNEVFKVKISRDLAIRLRCKLQQENTTYSSFAREQIKKYLEN